MSGIFLRSVAGKESFKVPLDKITIGRGPFLKVTDKRVSRNHATLEINKSGKLILTPIHTNPCFYKAGGQGQRETLAKDKIHVLNHGDVIGLLPDTLFYEVIYVDNQQTPTKRRVGRPPGRTKVAQKEPEESLSEDESFPNGETESHEKMTFKQKIAKVGNKPMAIPLDKKRKLPRWMVGAAKRVNLEEPIQGAEISPKKAKIAANVRQPRQNNVEQAELRTPKPGRGRPRKTVDEDVEEEELSQPTRRPRAASAKKPTYKDEYVMASDSESDFSNFSSDDEILPRKNRKLDDDDLDFVIEREDESDSDWDVRGKSASKPKGRGRGRGRPRKPSPVKRQKRKRRYSDDYFSDDDFDSYVPRPSKRRAAAAKKSRKSDDDEEESPPSRKRRAAPARKNRDSDDDVDEEPPRSKRKTAPVDKMSDTSESDEEEQKPSKKLKQRVDKAASPRKAKPAASKAADDGDDGDAEKDNDVKDSVPGKRRSCWFGKRCYRKNSQHRTEFCHPGDSSYEEDNDDDPRIPRKAHRGRKEPLREKDKRSVLHGASDDEGVPNTYDYDDSFLDDAPQGSSSYMDPVDEDDDWQPEEEESEGEDIKGLVKEARGFLKNKKLQKPIHTK